MRCSNLLAALALTLALFAARSAHAQAQPDQDVCARACGEICLTCICPVHGIDFVWPTPRLEAPPTLPPALLPRVKRDVAGAKPMPF